jgi:hypothetical protein
MLAIEPKRADFEFATAPIWADALVRRRPWVRFPPWAPRGISLSREAEVLLLIIQKRLSSSQERLKCVGPNAEFNILKFLGHGA